MLLLRTTPLVKLLIHLDTSLLSQSSIAQHIFSSPMLYTPHPKSAATCDPRYLKQSTSPKCSAISLTCIRPFPYLEHLRTKLLPTFTLNFLLSHSLPNSITSIHNFSSQPLALYHLQNNSKFISNLPPFKLSSSSFFPKHPSTSRTTPSIYIYIKQPWRLHTTIPQSKINWKYKPFQFVYFPLHYIFFAI